MRARMWASQRIDGELSELEGALLDAHLAGCADCRGIADGFAAAATGLRSTRAVSPLLPAAPHRQKHRLLQVLKRKLRD